MPFWVAVGMPRLGANGTWRWPLTVRLAASLRPETSERPSAKTASAQRTECASAATSLMSGARKRPDSVTRAV